MTTIKWIINLPTFDPNHLDLFGVSALIYAAIHRAEPQIYQLLIDKGADVNITAKNGQNNIVARHLMVTYPHSSEVIRILLDAGFDLNLISKRETKDIIIDLHLHAER